MHACVCVCVCVCVQVTDEILEINGQSTENMLHSDAITVIKSGGNTVRLVIRRAIEDGYQGETLCSCSVCVCVCVYVGVCMHACMTGGNLLTQYVQTFALFFQLQIKMVAH